MPLIAVDVPPPAGTEEDVKLLIGNSNEEIGQDLAKALLPKIPEGATGEVMIGTDTPGLPVLEQRNKGFRTRSRQERPGLKFIVFDAKQSPTDNFNTWSAQVKAHPDAVAYVGPGSQDAVSLSRIQRRGGKKLLVGACDLDPVALRGRPRRLRDGAHLARALAEGLHRDQAAGRGQAGRQAPARGRVELGRADRQRRRTSTRSSRARRTRRAARTYFKDEVAKQLAQPRRLPLEARGLVLEARGVGKRTAASSRSPARTSRSAPAPCTRCWARTGRASRRW